MPTGRAPALISVPTHFYKVILVDGRTRPGGKDNVAIKAFVLPNAPVPPSTPMARFEVPLQPLEQLAGEAQGEGVGHKEKVWRSPRAFALGWPLKR
eukprot:4333-Chlamydomonas_euryale.AAC.1